mgnify:CR=1 FL=1
MVFSVALPDALFSYYYQEPWGKDASLVATTSNKVSIAQPILLMDIANELIEFHQNHLSPTTCKRSHFRPSSSQYMKKAIQRYGFFQGFIMGCDRLLRENDELWVYKRIRIGDDIFKYDPALQDKYAIFLDYQ